MKEEGRKNWEKFALRTQEFSSIYLTREDRANMINSLFQVEKKLSEKASKFFLKQVSDKLASLVITQQNKYPWRNFVEKFSERHKGEDYVEVVARDLLLIEHVNKMYKKIINKQLNLEEEFKSENNLDLESFALVKFLYEKKFDNYMV